MEFKRSFKILFFPFFFFFFLIKLEIFFFSYERTELNLKREERNFKILKMKKIKETDEWKVNNE